MVKLKMAFIFAMIACILTAFSAILEQVRIVIMLYRIIISTLFFGLLGYYTAGLLQRIIEQKLRVLTKNQQHIELSQNPLPDEPSLEGQKTNFSPLTAENLEHITEMK